MTAARKDLVRLTRVGSVVQAEFVRMQLADHDIASVLLGQTAAGWSPEFAAPWGVEVWVAAADLEPAGRILAAATRRRASNPEEADPP